jgi:hypothetical protein
MAILRSEEPVAVALVQAIRGGDTPSLQRLLGEDPALASTRIQGRRGGARTLLHAASSDEVDVAIALIDGGADIEATGASIAGGGPLDDAVGYGCWHVARLLVERGAQANLWQAAALGMLDRVAALLDSSPPPTPDQLDEAFWQTCHGG